VWERKERAMSSNTQIGIMAIIIGIVFILSNKKILPFIGNLPGDIVYHGKHVHLVLPLTSMVLLSIIISAIIRLFAGK